MRGARPRPARPRKDNARWSSLTLRLSGHRGDEFLAGHAEAIPGKGVGAGLFVHIDLGAHLQPGLVVERSDGNDVEPGGDRVVKQVRPAGLAEPAFGNRRGLIAGDVAALECGLRADGCEQGAARPFAAHPAMAGVEMVFGLGREPDRATEAFARACAEISHRRSPDVPSTRRTSRFPRPRCSGLHRSMRAASARAGRQRSPWSWSCRSGHPAIRRREN